MSYYLNFSIGLYLVRFVYDKQIEGELKWLPDTGNTFAFVYAILIDLALIASLIGLAKVI